MKRTVWVFFLGFALFFVPLAKIASAGQAKAADEAKLAEQTTKIKADISKRLAHGKTRVNLKLRSGTKLKGRLNEAGNDDFTFIDEKTGKMTLTYFDVESVKGRGLSTVAKIGIITAIVATVVIVIGVVSFKHFDPFENGIVLR